MLIIYLWTSFSFTKGLYNLPHIGDDPDGVAGDQDDHDVDTHPRYHDFSFKNYCLKMEK